MFASNHVLHALVGVNPIWAEVTKPFKLNTGTAISFGGQPLGSYFLSKGLVGIAHADTIVALLTTDDVAGHEALRHATPSPITMQTLTECRGFKVIPKACRQIVEGCERSRRILDQYAYLASVLAMIQAGVNTEKVEVRLAYLIVDLVERTGEREIAFPHTKLATLIGNARRASISETFGEWTAAGLIEQVDRGLVRIKRVDVLETLAGIRFADARDQRTLFDEFLREIVEAQIAA